MTVPTGKPVPKKDAMQPSSRRRRRKRLSFYGKTDDRSVFLAQLTHSATPSADFYLLSILSGIIFGAAIFFDFPALYFMAALTAPFMAPIAGLALSTVSGSIQFFLRSLGALLSGAILVFGLGALGGVAARIWPDLSQSSLIQSFRFNWTDTLLLAAGAVFMARQLYSDPQKNPRLASAALAYGLYLPVAISGFSLVIGSSEMFQNGLITFAIHLCFAAIIGAAVFVLAGLRLRFREGYSVSGSLLLAAIAAMFILGGYGVNRIISAAPILQTVSVLTQTPAGLVTDAGILTVSNTPLSSAHPTLQASPTLASSNTPEPSLTTMPSETVTITLEPKPYMAVVKVSGAAGAYIREEPAGAVVNSILNGMWVEIQPNYAETVVNDAAWVYIRTDDGIEGWMMKSLLDIRTTTPLP